MPNQRSKNKQYLGGFVEKSFHDELMRLAKKEGMGTNKFGFAAQLLREALQRRQRARRRSVAR